MLSANKLKRYFRLFRYIAEYYCVCWYSSFKISIPHQQATATIGDCLQRNVL